MTVHKLRVDLLSMLILASPWRREKGKKNETMGDRRHPSVDHPEVAVRISRSIIPEEDFSSSSAQMMEWGGYSSGGNRERESV